MKYRVALFDDNADQREALELMLESSELMACVGSFPDGDRAVERVAGCTPDLVLMDIDMPHATGIECVALLRQRFPQLRILMRTVFEDDDKIFNAIRAGADGYLLKDMEPEDLLARIVEALRGRIVITESLSGLLARSLRDEAQAAERSLAPLTEREKDILGCLAGGLSNKLIARDLNIAEGTVKVHIKNLLKKLKFRSRLEAAVWAIDQGAAGGR